jgi:glycosyltransferase involved in cell wall biosynthesis
VRAEKLRVLHVTEAYGGGVASVLLQYSKHEIFDSSLLVKVREANYIDAGFPGTVRISRENTLIGFVREWFEHRKLDFDVVHVHSTIAGILVRLFPHKTAAIVYSPHAFAFIGHKSAAVRYFSQSLEKYLVSRTSAGGAVSHEEARVFSELGLSPEKVRVIPHQLHLPQRRPEMPVEIQIISIGRLSYQKNPEAVRPFKEGLENLGIRASWIWVGGGDEKYAEDLKSNGVRVTGWIQQEEVRRLLANSTFLFHPARYEGLPMAVLESLSEGIPVLASNIPSHSSLESVHTFSDIENAVGMATKLISKTEWERSSLLGQQEITEKYNAEAQQTALVNLYRIAKEV